MTAQTAPQLGICILIQKITAIGCLVYDGKTVRDRIAASVEALESGAGGSHKKLTAALHQARLALGVATLSKRLYVKSKPKTRDAAKSAIQKVKAALKEAKVLSVPLCHCATGTSLDAVCTLQRHVETSAHCRPFLTNSWLSSTRSNEENSSPFSIEVRPQLE